MEIKNEIALVTGANRGIGRHFVTELLARGAAKVYAAARTPGAVDVEGAVPLPLDVTDEAGIAAAADVAGDVTLLVNNAGVAGLGGFLDADLDAARQEMEVNYWGPLHLVRAFAPVLRANGGGAILNVLSQSSIRAFPFGNTYGASKAAAWQLTNGARLELAEQGTQVTGLAMALVDTDMSAWAKGSAEWGMADPAEIVRAALDGVEAGAFEVHGDEVTRTWRSRLGEPAESLYPEALGAVRHREVRH